MTLPLLACVGDGETLSKSISLSVLNKRQDFIKQHQRKESTPGGNHGNVESVVTVRLEPSCQREKEPLVRPLHGPLNLIGIRTFCSLMKGIT